MKDWYCCIFKDEKPFDRNDLQWVKNYGSSYKGKTLHTWDEGYRILWRCRKCGHYVLEQYSEIHMPDSVYIDLFPVKDEDHVERINERYDGFEIETCYHHKKIFFTYNYD